MTVKIQCRTVLKKHPATFFSGNKSGILLLMDNQICENRLTTIETKLAYIEDFLNQLQEAVVEQGKSIHLLQKENKLLSARLTELADNMESDIPNRPPPHY